VTWNNNLEQNTQYDYEGYTGSAQYYEQPRTQQQQTCYQSMQGSRPAYNQPPFMVTPLYSDGRLAATLCYSLGWLTGLLFLLFGAQRPFVRFHALQSLIFFGVINLIDIGLLRMIFVSHYYLGHYQWIWIFFLFLLLNFVAFVGWIVAMVQAGLGSYYRLPFVGNLIAKSINRKGTPRW
jgi:uncharacterized membrane protein